MGATTNPTKSDDKNVHETFNWSEVHLEKKNTSYKIKTLVMLMFLQVKISRKTICHVCLGLCFGLIDKSQSGID